MSKYRMICPECSAVIITACPESVVWEQCPACGRHVWDLYDAQMADHVSGESPFRHAIVQSFHDN